MVDIVRNPACLDCPAANISTTNRAAHAIQSFRFRVGKARMRG
ncbi:hypothetical protein C7S17_1260 [Burkholderia thailandensis]|nr:hypothetical protein [Burkholderia thailandensis]